MFGSACKFLSNLSYIGFDEISFLKLILDSAELEYIVINLVLLWGIVRFMLTTTAWWSLISLDRIPAILIISFLLTNILSISVHYQIAVWVVLLMVRTQKPIHRQSRIQSVRQSQPIVDLCYRHHIQMQYCYYSAQLTSAKKI